MAKRDSRPGYASVDGLYRMPKQIGPFVPRFQVGWGGTAHTFVGSRPGPAGTERLKLLKVPSPELLLDATPAEVRALFLNEAKLLERLPPTNIAPIEDIIDLGDDKGVICIVSTFIAGMDLKRLIKRGYEQRLVIPWRLVVSIVRDLASALDEAHTDHSARAVYNHGRIMHRDISPANIIVDHRGRGWLIDFGFGRQMDASRLDASRPHPGRLAYSAPEYLAGGGGIYDARLDLFSVGALAYETLTGRRAFAGKNLKSHLRQVWAKDYTDIRRLHPDLYGGSREPELEAFVRIVECLLEPDPNNRFQTAGALRAAVRSLRLRVDPLELGAIVSRYQDPRQRRIEAGRVSLPPDKSEGPRRTTYMKPPEEVFVEPATANEIGTLSFPEEEEADGFAETRTEAPAGPFTGEMSAPEASSIPATKPDREAAASVVVETAGLGQPFDELQVNLPIHGQPAPTSPPAAHPGRGSSRRTNAAVSLVVLLFFSLFLLSTINTLWVPLLTWQIRWTVYDGFWTPLLKWLGLAGVGVSLLGGLGLGIASLRRARRSPPAYRACSAHYDRRARAAPERRSPARRPPPDEGREGTRPRGRAAGTLGSRRPSAPNTSGSR